jgi:hypothetical protein
MLNIRIQQNVRIDFETVEKLIDIKARTGKSITEMYNEALRVYVDFEKKEDPHSVVGMPGEGFVPPTSGDSPDPVSIIRTEDAPQNVSDATAAIKGGTTFAERAALALGDDSDEGV